MRSLGIENEFPAYPETGRDYSSEVLWYARHIWAHGWRVECDTYQCAWTGRIFDVWTASIDAVSKDQIKIYGDEVTPPNDELALIRCLWTTLLAWVNWILECQGPRSKVLEEADAGVLAKKKRVEV